MPTSHAAACGGIAGLLLGVFIALINDMPFADAAYRLMILAMGGAWMGSILATLNDLLMPDNHTGSGRNQT
jgi:hypothetical protein